MITAQALYFGIFFLTGSFATAFDGLVYRMVRLVWAA